MTRSLSSFHQLARQYFPRTLLTSMNACLVPWVPQGDGAGSFLPPTILPLPRLTFEPFPPMPPWQPCRAAHERRAGAGAALVGAAEADAAGDGDEGADGGAGGHDGGSDGAEDDGGDGDDDPAPPAPSPILSQLTWLTADEVAQYLRLPSRKAVYEWVRRGLLPARRLGRRVLFNRAEVDDALIRSPTFNDVAARGTMTATPVCRGRRK